MPNHVHNILSVSVRPENVGKIFTEEEYAKMEHRPTTPEEEVAAFFHYISCVSEDRFDPNGNPLVLEGTFDFEKIVPMPENIFRGPLGQKERDTYGANNWYDWSLANWGTKWNSYDGEWYWEGESIQFNTAWSTPEAIYRALIRKFPNLDFEVKFADEDMGYNCGKFSYDSEQGGLDFWEPNNENEGVEFACEVWYDETPEDCGYKRDKNGNWVYDYGEDEEEAEEA